MKKKERDELVKQYNKGEIKALILSSAGGEGLDLKGTRLMQILDPHWNNEKLHQVEGRGIRYKSHDHLSPEKRKILVQRYLATRPPSTFFERRGWKKPGLGVDEYLTRLSQEKERLNTQFRELLKPPPDR
jgi:superfamily II DNA/RNA helicase